LGIGRQPRLLSRHERTDGETGKVQRRAWGHAQARQRPQHLVFLQVAARLLIQLLGEVVEVERSLLVSNGHRDHSGGHDVVDVLGRGVASDVRLFSQRADDAIQLLSAHTVEHDDRVRMRLGEPQIVYCGRPLRWVDVALVENAPQMAHDPALAVGGVGHCKPLVFRSISRVECHIPRVIVVTGDQARHTAA
jgi:hypothetical protein